MLYPKLYEFYEVKWRRVFQHILIQYQVIASQYHSLSNYQWRPYLPHIPSIIHSPFKKPSNTTLQLENGELKTVPQSLKKTTPNFHLLLPTEQDSDPFCKTTLSAMLLNYPPPTVVKLYRDYENTVQWERETLLETQEYLNNEKFVHDEDIVLIADGETSWFQLPTDVIIKQYAMILKEANSRLFKKYGVDKNGYQKYNQSIIFGASKHCEGDEMACRFAPPSIIPAEVYETDRESSAADMPAKYLDSKTIMGPAKDLRKLYKAALIKFDNKHNEEQNVQSIFATMFAEQQLNRDAEETHAKPIAAKVKDLFSAKTPRATIERELKKANMTTSSHPQNEFSIGLDYTHSLFQPLAYCKEHELIPLLHDNSTDLTKIRPPNSWSQYLSLPAALGTANPPFWRLDFKKNNPSPNEKPAYIKNLNFDSKLDELPKRKTSWNRVPLIQNTYTGAVPAIIINDPFAFSSKPDSHRRPVANITWYDMWYSPFKRALLRRYFRTPQSPFGYHNSLVGGDRTWDVRGGRGGVWTAGTSAWHPWGEVDGVCGSLNQLKEVFHDDRGVWLHEKESMNEETRLADEKDLRKKLAEEIAKDKEREREREKKEKEKQKEKQEKEEKQKQEKEDKQKQEQKEKELKALEDLLKEEEEAKKKAKEKEDLKLLDELLKDEEKKDKERLTKGKTGSSRMRRRNWSI